MDFDFDCPPALKEALHTRFKSGPGIKLANSIRIGMRAAIQELRHSVRDDDTNLEWNPLKGVVPEECQALQSIYEYLEAMGLTWTLGCLMEESVQPVGESEFDLVTLANIAIEEETVPEPIAEGETQEAVPEVITEGETAEEAVNETKETVPEVSPDGEATEETIPETKEEAIAEEDQAKETTDEVVETKEEVAPQSSAEEEDKTESPSTPPE
jgi:hypothetical protein